MHIAVVEAVCVVAIGIATVQLKPGAFTSDPAHRLQLTFERTGPAALPKVEQRRVATDSAEKR
jgi:hypothetical protein